jgi:hypothetical protein
MGEVAAVAAVELNPCPVLAAITRKPSCLISCSHALPRGGSLALVGRQGGTKPGNTGG